MQETLNLTQKAKKIFINILILIISCLFAFAIGEIYIRLFKHQRIFPRYVDTSPYGIRKNIGNVRGKMIHHEFKHKFNTNSQGFRGTREYSLDKPAGTYRIVVLGDSVTMGIGVEDDETFSAVLEKRLSLIKPAEVINMGVAGFGNAEHLIQLQNVGFKYNPDLVILAYFPNDPWENIVSRLFKLEDGKLVRDQENFVPAIQIRDRLYKIPGYSFLIQHSHLLNFIRDRVSNYFRKNLSQKNKFENQVPKVLTKEQAEFTSTIINKIIDEVNNKKIPLIILNIPVAINNEIYSNLPTDLIKISKEIYIIDAQKQIYKEHTMGELYYMQDYHPKPLGHKLIGEELASFISHL